MEEQGRQGSSSESIRVVIWTSPKYQQILRQQCCLEQGNRTDMEGSSDDNKIELQPKVRIYTLKYNASKDCQIACLNLFRRKAKMKWLEITNIWKNRPDRLTENANVSIGFFCKVGTGETTRGERNSEQELTEVTRCFMYIYGRVKFLKCHRQCQCQLQRHCQCHLCQISSGGHSWGGLGAAAFVVEQVVEYKWSAHFLIIGFSMIRRRRRRRRRVTLGLCASVLACTLSSLQPLRTLCGLVW